MISKSFVYLFSWLIVTCSQQLIAATANPVSGAEIFKQCSACHAIGAGTEHTIGPNLNHVFGRIAGSAEDYTGYSEGMQAKSTEKHIWHEKTLYKFLANPAKRVPGTSMAFAGLKTEQEIKDLLAYLIQYSPAYKPKSRKTVSAADRANAILPETKQASTAPEKTDFSDAFLSAPKAISSGEALWAAQCRHCHGSAAYPGKAPKLTPLRYTADFVFDRVTNGYRKMPAWKGIFSLSERMDLVAYILSDKFSP